MTHVLPACGRVAIVLALAAMLSVVVTPAVAQAQSSNATLTVSVVVSPSCVIRNDAGGFDLSCRAGAERTSRVTVEEPLLSPPADAWFYSPPGRMADPYAWLSRDTRRMQTASPWNLARPAVYSLPRARPIVLTVDF